MKILVLGLGVIGTTYGYLLHKSGNQIEHFIRPTSKDINTSQVKINLFDGRITKPVDVQDTYDIIRAKPNTSYDLIIISLPNIDLKGVLKTIQDNGFSGNLLFMSGLWDNRATINNIFSGYKFAFAYPVAGGKMDHTNSQLDCVVFDHIMFENQTKTNISNYNKIIEAFQQVNIKIEKPYDVLEWIWIHMAINAAVISTAGASANNEHDTSKIATKLMNSTLILRKTVLAIRDCLKIIKTRGIDFNNYQDEVKPYMIPAVISAPIMKHMFRTQVLTRRIMQLHANPTDLAYICYKIYQLGQNNNVEAPHFYKNYLNAQKVFSNFSNNFNDRK